jgi:dUTPase
MRIAQFVIVRRTEIRFLPVNAVADIGSERGGGFGHTGA